MANKFCKDDISKIENYDKAISDTTQTWECHHKLELTLNGEFAHTKKELIRLEIYYDRPYFELIFLTKSEHSSLHANNRQSKKQWFGGKTRREKHSLNERRIQSISHLSEFGIKWYNKFHKNVFELSKEEAAQRRYEKKIWNKFHKFSSELTYDELKTIQKR